jgi:dCTP diphosphatase
MYARGTCADGRKPYRTDIDKERTDNQNRAMPRGSAPNRRPTDPSDDLSSLKVALRRFASERDWDQFHSPKNLAIALSCEAAELLEIFQWMSEDSSRALSPDQIARVREEIADVLLYVIRLADKLDMDLLEGARDKLALNAQKYPIDRARGSSRKYTEL